MPGNFSKEKRIKEYDNKVPGPGQYDPKKQSKKNPPNVKYDNKI